MATALSRPETTSPALPRRTSYRFGSPLRRSQRAAGYLFVLPTFALFLATILMFVAAGVDLPPEDEPRD